MMATLIEEDDGDVVHEKHPHGDMKLWTKSQAQDFQPTDKTQLGSFFESPDANGTLPHPLPHRTQQETIPIPVDSECTSVTTSAPCKQSLLTQETQQGSEQVSSMDVDSDNDDTISLGESEEPFSLEGQSNTCLLPHDILATQQGSTSHPPHEELNYSREASARPESPQPVYKPCLHKYRDDTVDPQQMISARTISPGITTSGQRGALRRSSNCLPTAFTKVLPPGSSAILR